ncbi:hypothetical protein SCLCIDRAFT_605891 [Scleroderma citrinum Foug A]|uniref:Uncharacterized protein n=1 Tax=Scleroderma citrinum Foug A TaxID=1036808 RepID=A0A0C2ZFT2_9AGAM|nr:hypothetical protein SCLCIDRAFT_605891 [Scleroderma citrinum Foug A]
MHNTCSPPDHDMHSNPSNQQRRAPGGDTESLMEVDEGPINPSTPPRHTCIPDEVIQEVCEGLGFHVRPDYDDSRIGRSLDVVWSIVCRALSQDPDVCQRLASVDEYRSNVKHMGEKQFIDILRDLAKMNSWRNLLENDVFLKQCPVESSQSRWIENEDSVNGMELGIQRRCCKRAPCDHLQLP